MYTCRRPDGRRIQLGFFGASSSEGALEDVLSHAYATHLACVITADEAYCRYPWAVEAGETRVVKLGINEEQLEELREWTVKVGVAYDTCVQGDLGYVGSGSTGKESKSWIVVLK